MAIVERITQMKQQGISDPEIIKSLGEEGFTPRQINEGLAQSRIKDAVASPEQIPGEESMQQSIMPPTPEQAAASAVPIPAAPMPSAQAPGEEQYAQETGTYPQQAYPQDQAAYAENQYPAEGAYPQQAYPQDQAAYAEDQYPAEGAYPQEAYYQQALDSETVREISKQVTEESLNKLKKQISDLEKIKIELKFKIQNIDNRLTKIETVISELQSSILKRIGEYGENIQDISNEIKATQDSFSKMVSPLLDKKRGISKSAKTTSKKTSKKSSSKPKPKTKSSDNLSNDSSLSFEDYFR